MPTTWKVEQAARELRKAAERNGWQLPERLTTFSRNAEGVKGVQEALSSAGDPWGTAREAVQSFLGILPPPSLVAWQLHWLLSHMDVRLLVEDVLRGRNVWRDGAEAEDGEEEEAMAVEPDSTASPFTTPTQASRAAAAAPPPVAAPSQHAPPPVAGSSSEPPPPVDGGDIAASLAAFQRRPPENAWGEADLLDPARWAAHESGGGLGAGWTARLVEAGVGGSQGHEGAFHIGGLHLLHAALRGDRDAVLTLARRSIIRLSTLQLGAERGWGVATAFSDSLLGPLALAEKPPLARRNAPAFLAAGYAAADAAPPRSTAPRGAHPRGHAPTRGGGRGEGGACFICGSRDHYAAHCTEKQRK
jgi:hypothetical protein